MPPSRPERITLPTLVLAIFPAISCSGESGADREVDEPAPATAEPQKAGPPPEAVTSPPPETSPESPTKPGPQPAPDPGPKPTPEPAPQPPPAAEIKWGKKFVPHQNSKLPAKWTTCTKDSACTVLDVECCDHVSVNQKYAKQAREKLPHSMCDMECGLESVRGVCIKGKCGVQLGKVPGG
jgi:hypothetical protein